MAKIRKTASIEKGIEEVIKILNEEEIQEAIGKSVSYLRKCSDPDQPQEIDHNDSFKLDKACIKKHKAPPLFTAHEFMISQEFKDLDSNKESNISDMLVRFTILHPFRYRTNTPFFQGKKVNNIAGLPVRASMQYIGI